MNDMVFERDEMFEVILSDPEGGAKVGGINRTAVTITNDDGEYCCVYRAAASICFQCKECHHIHQMIQIKITSM